MAVCPNRWLHYGKDKFLHPMIYLELNPSPYLTANDAFST